MKRRHKLAYYCRAIFDTISKAEVSDTKEGMTDLVLRTLFEKISPRSLLAQLKMQRVRTVQQIMDKADAHF